MKKGLAVIVVSALVAGSAYYFTARNSSDTIDLLANDAAKEEEEGKSDREQRAFFVKERWKHEYRLLQDPDGKIPANIRQEEFKLAKTIPLKETGGINGPTNLNSYAEAGPNNIGGRTRAVAFDKRFNGTSNRVIIAGCVSGGIMRSADGGTNWTRVSPENDIHNLSSLVQDPRAGQENTWYAGGGENIGNSAEADGSTLYLGYGVWKSVDNGVTWTKLTRQFTDLNGTLNGEGTLEGFDNPFDIVHKIVVNPLDGTVYVAGHRRLLRSTNGGTSWNEVFAGTTATSRDLGQMDLGVNANTGRLYLGVNGGLPDQTRRGVWTSLDGTNWTRIAGGTTLNVDSAAGWRGNSYTGNAKRIVLALAPSNPNIVYVTYENGDKQDATPPKNEADLFKYDAGTNAWTNLSANVPNFPGDLAGVDPFAVQFGYNLMIAVKPDDANAVFLGGVNLFRSTNGFSSTAATTWIGGYGPDFDTRLSIYGSNGGTNGDITKWSHPDMHALTFDPSNANRAISANDGGIQITNNIMATVGSEPVSWTVLSNYQTLQYYHVAMDPEAGRNNFIGGAQDNGTRFRDASGILGTPANNSQYRILSGDGAASAIAKATGNTQLAFGGIQYGDIYRVTLSNGSAQGGSIQPTGLTKTPGGGSDDFGDFVTYFKIDFDNTSDLYYVNFNRLFRTNSSATVTPSTWTELTGVRSAVNPGSPTNGTNISITALELTRGDYGTNHAMYIGTSNGKVFRLDNPRSTSPTQAPVNITPGGLGATSYITDIAVNPNNDEEILVVASNYGIVSMWWCANAKSAIPTWRSIEGNLSLPSIRSCMIVVKKDGSNNPVTEYYVGTSVGLYSAVNLASLPVVGNAVTVSWVREGGNVLNYAVITSLDYRPQDNVLLVGTHGNGMYFANIGSPDFRPITPTGLPDPVRNDKHFITKAFPTIATSRLYYQTGDMFTVKRLIIRVHNVAGQEVLRKETGYTSGDLDTRKLSKGSYILTITSEDYKQQFVQQFVKE